MNTNREPSVSNKPESPHDDGYETGVAVNGPTSPGAIAAPPVAPKPNRGSGGGSSKPGPSRSETLSLNSSAFDHIIT